jgi:hypothetical protein
MAGIIFAALAGGSSSNQMAIVWNRSAWLTSAIMFALHIRYEHVLLKNPPRKLAMHVSLAVALGAFALAAAANVRALWSGSGNQRLLALALVLWPVLTALPAFVVAFLAAAGIARLRRRT